MKKKRGPQFPVTQFIAIIVTTICLFLVVDFGRRTAASYQIKGEVERLQQEVAAARARREALDARLAYVKSDDYVEEIARTQLKWAREGETVVVVMATPQPAPSTPPSGQPVSKDNETPQSSWHAWWFLFFDGPPPAVR